MHRRVPAQELRGQDSLMLEIQIGDLMAKPLRQVAFANVADLFAMDELEELSAALRFKLKGYRDRISRAVQDLPNGPELADFLGEVSELPVWRIPASLRAVLAGLADQPKRTAADQAVLAPLIASFETEAPRDFEMGARAKPKVVKGAERKPRTVRQSAGKVKGQSIPGVSPRAKSKRAPSTKTVVEVDPARQAWIRQTLIERLGRTENGLIETVLLAALKHRAREAYPDLNPTEVRGVLKVLLGEGVVRVSANRWSMPSRY